MKITDEDRMACARLETELRGDGWKLCETNLYCLVRSDLTHGPATPPDTASGREWWAETLKLSAEPNIDIDGNVKSWAVYAWGSGKTLTMTDRSEAITAAILAAARAHAEASKC